MQHFGISAPSKTIVGGLVNLNAAVPAQMMFHVLDVQLRHQLQKTLKKIYHIVLDDRKVKERELDPKYMDRI